MPQLNLFHEYACQKQRLLALIFAGAVLGGIVLYLFVRFVPSVNDRLPDSGRPANCDRHFSAVPRPSKS
jgi:hypothetical protein